MKNREYQLKIVFILILIFVIIQFSSVVIVSAGRARSANFIVEVSGGDDKLANEIANTAEKLRLSLAKEWLGCAMPNWGQPCMMTVEVAPHLGAGGKTMFVFDHGQVFGWRMEIQGSQERVLDSVLPHEITHMVYASFFRKPIPRWADEGGSTSMEVASEKQKHRNWLNVFLRTGRGIAFSQMFAMTEYPRDVMPLYAQAYSFSEYLIMNGGRQKYVKFLSDGMCKGEWADALKKHYGFESLQAAQDTWLKWVSNGFPEIKTGNTQPTTPVITAPTTPAKVNYDAPPIYDSGIKKFNTR